MGSRFAIGAAATLLLLSSCSDSDSSTAVPESSAAVDTTSAPEVTAPPTTGAPETTPPSTEKVTTSTAPTTPGDCAVDGDTAAKDSGEPLAISPTAFGSDIAASAAPCVELITLRFQGEMTSPSDFPGWSVKYAEAPVVSDTGAVFGVAGAATLLIRVGAMMPNAEGDGYAGPTQFAPTGVSHVLELLNVSNADGSATWAIALDAEYPFAVTVPDGPPRIVIELQTGA